MTIFKSCNVTRDKHFESLLKDIFEVTDCAVLFIRLSPQQEQAHKPSTVHMVVKHKRHDSPVHLQFKMDRYSRNLACRRRRFRCRFEANHFTDFDWFCLLAIFLLTTCSFCSSSRQWYKLILADKAKWQADMEAMRKERQSVEMKECTFRPEIQKKKSLMKVKDMC